MNHNNFDLLFQNRTPDQLNQYLNVIRDIRKGARTKKQKINALTKQMHFMNLMFNVM